MCWILRITGGKNPLDATSVHPESYEAATKLLEMLGYQLEDIAGGLTGLSLMAKIQKTGRAGWHWRDYVERYYPRIGEARTRPA